MNLLNALARVSGFTLLSRITGLAREFLIARAFGAGALTDAFFVAFRIPNLLRRLFAEGAFGQAFVPILTETKTREGDEAARVLVGQVAACLALVLVGVTILGVLGAPLLVMLTAPGFVADAAKFEITVQMLRIVFPYILLIGLTAFAGAVLNCWGRFAVPAFTPVLLNLAFIAAALWLAPQMNTPVLALAIAVVIGGVAQLALQWVALARVMPLPKLIPAWRSEGVQRILKNMLPSLFGVSVAQLSLIINTIIASLLVSGSVSWLYYADRLMEFPMGLLGVALGTVLLPSLSKAATQNEGTQFSELLDWGLRLTFLLALPAASAMALLATPLTATLYHYGAFSGADVLATRGALMAYSVGLLGLMLIKILAPGYYAKQDIRTPVKIAVIALIATQLCNVALVGPLKHVGLALSIGLGACLNAWLLWRGLHTRRQYVAQPGWGKFLVKLLVALAMMLAVLSFITPVDARWIEMRATPWARLGWLMTVVIAGAAAYFAMLAALGFRLADFRRRG